MDRRAQFQDGASQAQTCDLAVVSALGIRTVFAAFAGQFLGVGVLLVFSFGVFVTPIAESTGWNRTLVTAAIAPAAVAIGLMAPLVGWSADRFGPRKVALVSGALQAIGLVLIGVASNSLTMLTALIVLTSVLGSAQSPVPYSLLIAGWFKRQRGMALGISLAGGGLGIAIIPLLAALLIEWFNWRAAFMILGIIAGVVTISVAWFMIKDPPVATVAERERVPGQSLAEALRMPSFWIFLIAFLLNAMAAAGGSISMPVVLSDRGSAPETAAAAMTVVGIAIIVARLGFGVLLDRFPPVLLSAIVLGSPLIGYLLLLSHGPLWTAFAAALCFGIATGAEGDALSYLISRKFGMRHFGRIYGLNFLGFALGTGIGPALLGWLRDSASYDVAFMTLACVAVIASLLILSQARRPLSYE